jgi:hypothetical protein
MAHNHTTENKYSRKQYQTKFTIWIQYYATVDRLVYACRTNIRVKTESDSHDETYSAELATRMLSMRVRN